MHIYRSPTTWLYDNSLNVAQSKLHKPSFHNPNQNTKNKKYETIKLDDYLMKLHFYRNRSVHFSQAFDFSAFLSAHYKMKINHTKFIWKPKWNCIMCNYRIGSLHISNISQKCDRFCFMWRNEFFNWIKIL